PLHKRIYQAVNDLPKVGTAPPSPTLDRLIVFEAESPTTRFSIEEMRRREADLWEQRRGGKTPIR
ncbi:hypothetical protein JW905_01100, partial [bacterium]|nr:hypothetical protein [candidate division CSSED10-310 bacterium]